MGKIGNFPFSDFTIIFRCVSKSINFKFAQKQTDRQLAQFNNVKITSDCNGEGGYTKRLH